MNYQLSTKNSFAESPCIRVAIIQDAASLNLKVNGSYEVIDSLAKKILYRGNKLNTTVASYKEGILLGNVNPRRAKILIKSADPAALIINGRRFSGYIELIKKEEARLLVVNYIDLQDYIKGILYNEASHYWPIEALRAQAIVCRTYALYQAQVNKARDYDVTADIYSQVYGGRGSERLRTNKAVEQTKGMALTYQGKFFPAYFHATCAGHTEDASLLWSIDIEPLKGRVCDFCRESPHYKWNLVLSKNEIRDKLNAAGYRFGGIKEIAVLNKNRSSRVAKIKICSEDKDTEISAKDFRHTIGPNIIRSTKFNLASAQNDIIFEGLGWGHGVGMCQWGAYFMAKQGYAYQQILEYYYPGSKIASY